MRTNLENIRKVDEYLADELNASEKTAFEQELTSNHELQDLLDEQTLFIASVNRASLRSQIENVAGGSGFNFTKWLPVIVVGLMIASAAVWVSMPETNQLATVQEEISTVSKSESESPATINAPVTANEPVPVESSTAKPQRRYTPRAKIYECGGHKTWVAPDVQHFAVDPADGATIEGKDGILIIVPTDAFLDEKGDMVTTPVDFELVEALTLEDMVLYNLKTTSNGKMLESGGMFYANATSEGKPLQINPKRPLYIEIPTSDKQAGMQAFSSEIVDGEVNWVDPKPLQKFLVKVDLNELDFLPTGFADEVKINMPYKNHKTATEQLIDSLYYALGFGINATELSVDEEIIAGTYSTVKGVKGLKMWSGSSDMAIANLDTLATASCGVDPTAVQTIKQNTYANSFIATREFESRIIELHKLKNGQALLDLYVNNLGKNLWEVDQMASRDANSTGSKIFTKFSQEKLTNLKDANIYQSRLSAFYKMKQNELTKAKNKLVKELQQKNDAEIRALVKKYQKQREEWLKDQRSAQAKLPKPSAATSPVYATQWATFGWANIDQYMHMLSKGPVKEIAITIEGMPRKGQVYQWLNTVNTMTGLAINDNDAIAAFPKKPNAALSNTYCIAIGMDGGDYFWDYHRYNPYKTDSFEIEMALTSLADIRLELQSTDVNMGQIRTQMKRHEKMLANQLKWRQQSLAKQKELAVVQNKLRKHLREIQVRQQMEQAFMTDLRKVSFPCEAPVRISETVEEVLPRGDRLIDPFR